MRKQSIVTIYVILTQRIKFWVFGFFWLLYDSPPRHIFWFVSCMVHLSTQRWLWIWCMVYGGMDIWLLCYSITHRTPPSALLFVYCFSPFILIPPFPLHD